jgi:glutamate-1-semialdehyde 2,1-aminomutase
MKMSLGNLELTRMFDKVYPGSHSNLRKVSVQVSSERIFIVRGKGARVWDADGKEYVDFVCGAGPNILGHCHPEFIRALKDQLDTVAITVGSGMLFTPHDIEVAEKIENYVPCAEKVKFCATGTEAVQIAIRLARAYTGRPYFVRFEGHYHGWMDNVLGGVGDHALFQAIREGKPVTRKPLPLRSDEDILETEGRSSAAFEDSLMIPWNDFEVLERVIEEYGQQIAMIHCEPITVNHGCMPPMPGFLERVRELCTQYGIVFSFDEVITGFRVGLGGAQKELGVTPDITTFGKAMAAGLPCSAVVGKNEIMELLRNRRVLGPGTYMGYPLGMAAALATIRILERDDGAVYREFDRLQARLTDGLKSIAKSRGIPLMTQGCRGAFNTYFVDKEVVYTDEDLAEVDWVMVQKFWDEMAKEGILGMLGARWYLSVGLTDADIDVTLEAAEHVMGRLK